MENNKIRFKEVALKEIRKGAIFVAEIVVILLVSTTILYYVLR